MTDWGAWLQTAQGLLPPSVQPLELLWSTPALIGWASYSLRYVRAWQQRARERRDGINGARGLVLAGRCVRFLALTVAFECLLGGGIVAMMLPPGGLPPGHPWAALVPALLFTAQLVLLAKGVWLDRIEAALRRLLELRAAAEAPRE